MTEDDHKWECVYCERTYLEYVNACPFCLHAVVLRPDVQATKDGFEAAKKQESTT